MLSEALDATWDKMAQTDDVHAAISDFFREAAQILSSQDAPCGCLVILAATNVSAEAEEVNTTLKALRDEGKEWLVKRIERAVADRHLPPTANPYALGLTLNTLLEGMSLAARDGASHEELDLIATSAARLLPDAS